MESMRIASPMRRSWPPSEQDAIDGYLDAVWRSLLAEYPSRLGSFTDAYTFLDAARSAGEGVDRFLDVWDATTSPAADRHLAELVSGLNYGARRPDPLVDWAIRDAVRDRLCHAFERDVDEVRRAALVGLIRASFPTPPHRSLRTRSARSARSP